jgi:hypothetical protein
LSFFRRKKSEDKAPPTRAPELPQAEPLTVESSTAPVDRDGQSSTTQPKKRRRGTRGGRNRKKSTAAGGGATAATAAASATPPEPKAEPKKTER